MDDNARIFETHLLALENSSVAPGPVRETDDGLHHAATPVRDDLQLVAALRTYRLPEHETSAARERVFTRLASALAETDTTTCATSEGEAGPLHAIGRHQTGRWRRRSRVAAALAALLAIGMLGGWQVSSAAAAANPDSPLYSVKRVEERLALATAWSDSRRGEVLMTIADNRLSELLYESGRHDQTRVRGLAIEYDGTMRSLINLTVTMQRQHEDVHAVLADLSHALNLEGQAVHSAQASGDVTLSQTLASAINSQRGAIRAGNLNIVAPTVGAPPSQSIPAGTTPSATRPERGASQAPRQNTTGASQKGNGQNGSASGGNGGNGGNGSNSNGQGGGSGSGNRPSGAGGGGQKGNGGNSQSSNSQSNNSHVGGTSDKSTSGAGIGTSGGSPGGGKE